MNKQIISASLEEGIKVEYAINKSAKSMQQQHYHSHWEVYYLVEGERFYFIGNHTYHIRTGDLILIQKNQIHKTTGISSSDNSNHSRILFAIDDRYISEEDKAIFLKITSCSPVVHVPEDNQALFKELFASIYNELMEKDEYSNKMIALNLSRLFISVFRLSSNSSANVPAITNKKVQKVDMIAKYITTNYKSIVNLDDLCNVCYISKYHMARIFKEVTGFTVYEYITMVRIQAAQELLQSSDISVTEVAYECGYTNIISFENNFKLITGMTPSSFRKIRRSVYWQRGDK